MKNFLKSKGTRIGALMLAAMFVLLSAIHINTPVQAQEDVPIVDAPTYDNYKSYFGNSTENIGRIWSDKTVLTESANVDGQTVDKNTDSEFQVMLSALSSRSNTTVSESKPLDIVMVLDVSGSMKNKNVTYKPVYDVPKASKETSGKYYILVDGEYKEVEVEEDKKISYYYYKDSKKKKITITPKISKNDVGGQIASSFMKYMKRKILS